MLALQTNGFADSVADLVAVITTGAEIPDDDGVAGDCHCPPGCPSCHTSPVLSVVPPAPSSQITDGLLDVAAAPVAYEASVPPGPERRSVYRPPRLPDTA